MTFLRFVVVNLFFLTLSLFFRSQFVYALNHLIRKLSNFYFFPYDHMNTISSKKYADNLCSTEDFFGNFCECTMTHKYSVEKCEEHEQKKKKMIYSTFSPYIYYILYKFFSSHSLFPFTNLYTLDYWTIKIKRTIFMCVVSFSYYIVVTTKNKTLSNLFSSWNVRKKITINKAIKQQQQRGKNYDEEKQYLQEKSFQYFHSLLILLNKISHNFRSCRINFFLLLCSIEYSDDGD